jgi:hypothetical protein
MHAKLILGMPWEEANTKERHRKVFMRGNTTKRFLILHRNSNTNFGRIDIFSGAWKHPGYKWIPSLLCSKYLEKCHFIVSLSQESAGKVPLARRESMKIDMCLLRKLLPVVDFVKREWHQKLYSISNPTSYERVQTSG